MSSLSILKNRLLAIKKTIRITKVIQTISIGKLSKIKNNINSISKIENYLENKLINSLYYSNYKNELINNYFSSKNSIILVLSSDSGMCGNFNTLIQKELTVTYKQDKKNIKIYSFGKKINEYIKKNTKKENIISLVNIEKQKYNEKEAIIEEIISQTLLKDNPCEIIAIYAKFINNIKYEVCSSKIFPFTFDNQENLNYTNLSDLRIDDQETTEKTLFYYLKSKINKIIDQHLMALYSARINATENATKNGKDLSLKISIEYNKNRQAKVTNELLDIISGSLNV